MEGSARKNRLHIDWMIIFATIALVFIGLLTIYSTGSTHSGGKDVDREFYMQFVWFVVGILLFFGTISISYNKYVEWSLYLYAGGLALLLISLLFPPVKGIRAWINLGFFNIQPAELMKLFTSLLWHGFSTCLVMISRTSGISLSPFSFLCRHWA